MVVVMAFVWGGFAWVLTTAIRKESLKSGDGRPSASAATSDPV
jgi:hypothetical protein